MKTFEEKFTAWIDGELKGEDLATFETELAGVEDADLDRAVAHQLGDLLREHGRAPSMPNVDFFNHQVMERIRAEMPAPAKKTERRSVFSWFSMPRLALAGACAAAAIFAVVHHQTGANSETAKTAEIIKINAADPDIRATAFYSQKNGATVLWLDWKNTPTVPVKHSQDKDKEKHSEKSTK